MYQTLINEIIGIIKPYFGNGTVANYIPALSEVSPIKFGISVESIDAITNFAGDADEPFSIQSISKVFSLTLAIQMLGDDMWRHVGRRLSSRAFNSIMSLEESNGQPRNPFTNAGAIAIVDLLLSHDRKYLDTLLEFVRNLAANNDIVYDMRVAMSEKKTGYRNAAIANFLKSYGVIKNSVNDVLDAYFVQCSLAMSCRDLSHSLLFLANSGEHPHDRSFVISPRQNSHLNALMMMFGTYDAAGDFAFRIGLPGKSGVGGGITVTVPNKMAIAVWSPELDEFGTSVVGLKALELFIEKADLCIL